ncbi:MAG: hypothetical protein AAGJ46_21725 [Planctomycetota bacterium]
MRCVVPRFFAATLAFGLGAGLCSGQVSDSHGLSAAADAELPAEDALGAKRATGRTGTYADAHGGTNPSAGGATFGWLAYLPKYKGLTSARFGIGVLGADSIRLFDSDGVLSLGGELGVRLQAPSRLAPFVGLGGYTGWAGGGPDEEDSSDPPGGDADGLGRSDHRLLSAVYPEVGVHTWLTPNWRLTAMARHYEAFTGVDSQDYQTFGFSLAYLRPTGGRAKPKVKPAKQVASNPEAAATAASEATTPQHEAIEPSPSQDKLTDAMPVVAQTPPPIEQPAALPAPAETSVSASGDVDYQLLRHWPEEPDDGGHSHLGL